MFVTSSLFDNFQSSRAEVIYGICENFQSFHEPSVTGLQSAVDIQFLSKNNNKTTLMFVITHRLSLILHNNVLCTLHYKLNIQHSGKPVAKCV